MPKNILIISSDHTGHGHKSITEAICEQIPNINNTNIKITNGFSLGGAFLLKIGKSYGPITRYSKFLWKIIWDLSSKKPDFLNKIVQLIIEKSLLELIDKFKPDSIISVHPNFNGSVLNILEKYDIKIPFITLIADLVSIYPLWADNRVSYIISPTIEAKQKCLDYGVDESKIKVMGFPVRSKFYEKTNTTSKTNTHSSQKFKCLIMSGGEGVGNMKQITECLLNNFNCEVNIIAGRNTKLKAKLSTCLKKRYGENVNIFGFVEDIENLIHESDIAFTRGSPNVIMEAVACNVPIIITSALPGQEEGNPGYVEKYNLGVLCNNINNLKFITESLFKDNGYKIKQIKKQQQNYFNPYVSKDICNFLMNLETYNILDKFSYSDNYTLFPKSKLFKNLKYNK